MTPQIAAEKPLNEFGRVIGVYLDPRETFRDVAARPRWWVPMIIGAVCSLVFIYCFSQRVGWEQMIRQTIEASPRVQEMPREVRAQMIERGARFAPIATYAAAVVGRPAAIVVCAGIFLLVFNVFMGGKIAFPQAFAVTSYSFLTLALSSVLSIVTLYLKAPEDFDIRNPLAFNLGFFLSDDSASKATIALANSIDLFSLWTLVVIAIGFSVIGKMSFTKALVGVAIPWLLYVALAVARVAAFGQ